MASRPLFIPSTENDLLVKTVFVEFTWSAGLAVTQKQKSIESLHQAAVDQRLIKCPLEVSSKSTSDLGIALSAFNLSVTSTKSGKSYSVECMFQSAKVFSQGGPFKDLLDVSPKEAKRDARLVSSGDLIGFNSNGKDWPLEPKTLFYDWLYLKALQANPRLAIDLMQYDCFTDIEFNPKKSINCQAYSAALYVSLDKRGLLRDALDSPRLFAGVIDRYLISNSIDDESIQPGLF